MKFILFFSEFIVDAWSFSSSDLLTCIYTQGSVTPATWSRIAMSFGFVIFQLSKVKAGNLFFW